MRRCLVVLAVVSAGLAACTSPPSGVGNPTKAPSSASPGPTPAARGLHPVDGYSPGLCDNGVRKRCAEGAVPDELRRELQIPTIAPGAQCPVSEANPLLWSRAAPGLGPGPVAPVLLENGVLRYRPRFHGSDWGVGKVLWVSAPEYDGPILIRGKRVDGAGGVGFTVENWAPLAELQLPPGLSLNTDNGGWRNWPSATRIRAPGCYAYQVDGTDFSYVIVFRAVISR
jgi:hypothetical protein